MQWPRVGRRICVSSFSVVDLPAPFGPMMPSAFARLTSKPTSFSAQNSSPSSHVLRWRSAGRTTQRDGIRSRRLSWRSPRRNFFQT